jgi:hypothetical protein
LLQVHKPDQRVTCNEKNYARVTLCQNVRCIDKRIEIHGGQPDTRRVLCVKVVLEDSLAFMGPAHVYAN